MTAAPVSAKDDQDLKGRINCAVTYCIHHSVVTIVAGLLLAAISVAYTAGHFAIMYYAHHR